MRFHFRISTIPTMTQIDQDQRFILNRLFAILTFPPKGNDNDILGVTNTIRSSTWSATRTWTFRRTCVTCRSNFPVTYNNKRGRAVKKTATCHESRVRKIRLAMLERTHTHTHTYFLLRVQQSAAQYFRLCNTCMVLYIITIRMTYVNASRVYPHPCRRRLMNN